MRDTYKLEKFDYSDRTVLEDVIDAVHDPKSGDFARISTPVDWFTEAKSICT